KKMGQSATNIKVSKKLWSFFTAKVWRLNNLVPLCFAIRDPVGVNVNKVVSTRVGSVGSIVDVGYESGGDLVHFSGGFDFTLTELLTASTKFLNENPYWRTYVAYLADGSQVIVKRILTQLSQNKFVNVVSALGKIRHPNVLDLKAYYWGSGETLCVFKFTPNGSVSSLLQSSENQSGSIPTFDWTMRIKIITGITKGLFYLHTREKIVHGDLKSSMILLDENYNPMIANVGLSQLMSTAPRSLGIIMLELLTGQSTYKGIHPVDLPTWVKSVPKEKWSAEAFDVKLMQEKSEDHNVMVNVMRLSLQCVEDDPKARPTVRDVFRVLEQIESVVKSNKHYSILHFSHALTDCAFDLAMCVRKRYIGKSELDLKPEEFHHPNLAKLLGYCLNEQELSCAYETITDTSLDKLWRIYHHLLVWPYVSPGTSSLSWVARLKIAVGAANGLCFLHQRRHPAYTQFKTTCILVDMDYNARLWDFEVENSFVALGSYSFQKDAPYAAPEWFRYQADVKFDGLRGTIINNHGENGFGVKSEIYAFGVVLLELLTGMKVYDDNRPQGKQNLVKWAIPLLTDEEDLGKIIDPQLQHESILPKGAYKLASLVSTCLHPSQEKRPPIEEIYQVLNHCYLEETEKV
ncbi:kinase RLK-Pelle-CrRLK1L-1 family protein, partial [Tanacetum coccineum]